MIHSRTRRLAALIFTVAITAVCLAACGSSSSTGSNSSSSSSASAVASAGGGAAGSAANRSKLVACLKAHGVTLPARPRNGAPPANRSGSESGSSGSGSGTSGRRPGGGFFFGGGGAGGRFANNPTLRAAFQACGRTAGFGGARRFSLNHAAVTKFVACVKQHGYNLPAPNFSGKGSIFPAGIQNNKAFQAASKACASDLRPAGAPGGPGGGAPPTGSSTTGA